MVGAVPGILVQTVGVPTSHQFAQPPTRSIDIAKVQCARRAHLHTHGLQPLLYAVVAGITLVRGADVAVEADRAVGTEFTAILATDTHIGVDLDQTVIPLMDRIGRAVTDARRAITVLAHHRPPLHRQLRETAVRLVEYGRLLQVENPQAVLPDRHPILHLAGDAAGIAADAAKDVDHKAAMLPHVALPSAVFSTSTRQSNIG